MERLRNLVVIGVLVLVATMNASCAGKNPPTIARDVAVNGKALTDAVDAVQKVIIDAEAKGSISRNAAVTSMEAIKKTLAYSQEVATALNTLTTVTAGSGEEATLLEKVEATLALVSSGLLDSIAPISNDATRQQVAKLATAVTNIVGEINRQLIRR